MLTIFAVGGVYGLAYLLGPPPIQKQHKTVYYSADKEIIGTEHSANSNTYVTLDDISKPLIDATLAVEDRNFYNHYGFDVKRIGGAILKDIQHLSLKQGASTLTQQYARNLYLSHEKTWNRKAKEALYTVRLEMFNTKDEILEGYLNRIYYGHGAYGIEAASKYYFGKSASDLKIEEAAMLAGIPKGPTYYSPLNNLERATERQHLILGLLQKNGDISNEEYEIAKQKKLTFNKETEREPDDVGPYFQDMALKEATKLLDTDIESVRSGGYKIYTTLDQGLQKKLENKVAENVAEDSEIEVGAMSINPQNGDIRALVGGKAYEKSTFNRAISAKRMPGSTFKPFLYYQALEHGYTATTMLMSEETTFELASGKEYSPRNYNGYYENRPITLAQALALSDNIYAVKTNLFLEPEKLTEFVKTIGIDRDLPKVASLALGTASVSVQEMVNGYGVIANGGKQIENHTITKIENPNGDVLYKRHMKRGKEVLDRKKAFILTQLMTGMFDTTLNGSMSVTGASVAPELTQNYAGKSGSTNVDSWMIGYSPTLLTGIWTGYDDNRDIEKADEMAYAKNIWSQYMEAAHAETEKLDFLTPAGVVAVDIDPLTGKRATPYCETKRKMYFEKGTVPTESCTLHMHGAEMGEWIEDGDDYPEPPDPEHDEKKKKLLDGWQDLFR